MLHFDIHHCRAARSPDNEGFVWLGVYLYQSITSLSKHCRASRQAHTRLAPQRKTGTTPIHNTLDQTTLKVIMPAARKSDRLRRPTCSSAHQTVRPESKQNFPPSAAPVIC